jgi:hypothetical protein
VRTATGVSGLVAQRRDQADVGQGAYRAALDVVELHDDAGRRHDDGPAGRLGGAGRCGSRTTTGSSPDQPGGAPRSTVTTQSAQPVPRAVQVSQSMSMALSPP